MAVHIPVTAILFVLLLTPLASGGNEKRLPAGSQAAARKLSDAFMADLTAG